MSLISFLRTRTESCLFFCSCGLGKYLVYGICLQCRRLRFYPWVRQILWRRDRLPIPVLLGFPVVRLVKNLPAMQETWVRSLSWEDPLEKGKAIHSSILAWRIPWTVNPMRSQRVRHDDWVTFTSLHFNIATVASLCLMFDYVFFWLFTINIHIPLYLTVDSI